MKRKYKLKRSLAHINALNYYSEVNSPTLVDYRPLSIDAIDIPLSNNLLT